MYEGVSDDNVLELRSLSYIIISTSECTHGCLETHATTVFPRHSEATSCNDQIPAAPTWCTREQITFGLTDVVLLGTHLNQILPWSTWSKSLWSILILHFRTTILKRTKEEAGADMEWKWTKRDGTSASKAQRARKFKTLMVKQYNRIRISGQTVASYIVSLSSIMVHL